MSNDNSKSNPSQSKPGSHKLGSGSAPEGKHNPHHRKPLPFDDTSDTENVSQTGSTQKPPMDEPV